MRREGEKEGEIVEVEEENWPTEEKKSNISKAPRELLGKHFIHLLKRQDKAFFTSGVPDNLATAQSLDGWPEHCVFGLWKRTSPGGYNLTFKDTYVPSTYSTKKHMDKSNNRFRGSVDRNN